MNKFAQEMAFYSAYHQERTNIWIHVAGVPTILFSAFVAVAGFDLFSVGGFTLTAAWAYFAITSLFYLRLDITMGLIATALYGTLCYFAHDVAAMGSTTVLAVFLSGQIVGWGAQIYGHLHFERNRPAFYENIMQSFVSAPIFVIADVLFHLGFKRELQRQVKLILADTGRLRQFEESNAPATSA